MSFSPLKIIISAGAGTSDKNVVRERLASIFNQNKIDIDMSVAQSGAEVTELAQDAARGSYKVVVAAGGDGTVNTVASAVMDNKKILGVLPVGTLNHFAKDLGIPLDLEAAVHTIVAGHTTEVDVGEVNNRLFLNNSSLGLYPMI